MQAMNSNRMLGMSTFSQKKSTEKLTSGYKINRAADDAAGLAISEKMRRQIRGLTQASTNCQDGISFCQIADGALEEVHDMLKRCEQLAIKAANGTNTEQDREFIQSELDQLSSEIDRVHSTTVFNEKNIFSNDGILPDKAPVTSDQGLTNTINFVTQTGIRVTVGMVDVDGNRVDNPAETRANGTENSAAIRDSELAEFAVQAAANAIDKLTAAYPDLFDAASTSGVKVGLDLSNIDGTGKTLATASLSLSSGGSSTVMSYKLHIDTSDYKISEFNSYSAAKKADLAAVIAHEMTHLVMYDTVTSGMLKGRESSFPMWFIEGSAQTSSGDNGWLSNRLNPSSGDAAIKSYMSELDTMPYGAGYLATMYLGMSASGEKPTDPSKVTGANIAKGLDKILTDVAKGKSFSAAIKDNTGYTSQADFQQKFKNGDAAALSFAKNLLNVRGTSGGGSILYDLNLSEADAFGTLSGSSENYQINKDNTWYSNAYGTGFIWPEIIDEESDGNVISIQAGAEAGQHIDIKQYNVSAYALFGGQKMTVTNGHNAPSGDGNAYTESLGDDAEIANTIDIIKEADKRVSTVRSYYGALQNRLEHTINNLDNVVENTTSAESLLRDTDMAAEMVAYANNNILMQAGQAMLAQANQTNQGVLSLLQ